MGKSTIIKLPKKFQASIFFSVPQKFGQKLKVSSTFLTCPKLLGSIKIPKTPKIISGVSEFSLIAKEKFGSNEF